MAGRKESLRCPELLRLALPVPGCAAPGAAAWAAISVHAARSLFYYFFKILFPCSTPSALGGVGVNITFCIATCQLAGTEPGQAPATPTARR